MFNWKECLHSPPALKSKPHFLCFMLYHSCPSAGMFWGLSIFRSPSLPSSIIRKKILRRKRYRLYVFHSGTSEKLRECHSGLGDSSYLEGCSTLRVIEEFLNRICNTSGSCLTEAWLRVWDSLSSSLLDSKFLLSFSAHALLFCFSNSSQKWSEPYKIYIAVATQNRHQENEENKITIIVFIYSIDKLNIP